MNKQFFLYINGLSDFGSRMHFIAVTALLFTFPDSERWLMLFLLARQVGGILSSLFAGVLADRFDRRRLMIASDMTCGIAVLVILLVPHPGIVVLSAFVLGVTYSVFDVSFQASIPKMFEQDTVLSTNARLVRFSSLAGLIGFAVSGFVSDALGYQWIILFDAGTFFLSAAVLSALRWDSRPEHQRAAAQVMQEMRDGFRYIRQAPVFLLLTLTSFFYSLGGTSWNYGLPFLSQTLTEHASIYHGLMWAMIGSGSFMGSFFLSKLRLPLLPALYTSMLLFAGVITAVFFSVGIVAVFGGLFLAGLVDAATQTFHRTLMQQADNSIRGRVLGVQSLLNRAGYLCGFLCVPLILGWTKLSGMVLIIQGGIGVAILAGAGFVIWKRN
ncbi:MFS transporter [Brevibacillus migulae]|uniref:MFS transporter n=1 Tax=Brevibacillus migulae TaxID=1644114 RepID=UPI00106E7FA2|nr:MFS transporter [Brevibacillus migulae]